MSPLRALSAGGLLLPALLLAGCPSDKDGAPDDTNVSDDTAADTVDTTPPPWHPTSGDYTVTPGVTRKDTCQFPTDGGGGDTSVTGATEMGVTVAKDYSAFDVLIPSPDGGNPATYTCALTEYDFHCDVADVTDTETAGQYGLDAAIIIAVDNDGTWSDETTFAGVYTLAVDCLGDDCSLVARAIRDGFSFPCGAQYEYSAAASM